MPAEEHPLVQLLKRDQRYRLEAYQFVREGLDYAQRVLGMGISRSSRRGERPTGESHLSGQELSEALRRFAIEQFGFMAKWVLNSWGIHSTSDFGELVYNMIAVNLMRKSETDRREDFDDVYDFDEAFVRQFQIHRPG
ncbi:MAG: hypothetical protein GX575_25805 [Candidatus Anammoximicrobium sp.]|nr:hypothetical protein [Candidatus Anammoximicrobium sp.]